MEVEGGLIEIQLASESGRLTLGCGPGVPGPMQYVHYRWTMAEEGEQCRQAGEGGRAKQARARRSSDAFLGTLHSVVVPTSKGLSMRVCALLFHRFTMLLMLSTWEEVSRGKLKGRSCFCHDTNESALSSAECFPIALVVRLNLIGSQKFKWRCPWLDTLTVCVRMYLNRSSLIINSIYMTSVPKGGHPKETTGEITDSCLP